MFFISANHKIIIYDQSRNIKIGALINNLAKDHCHLILQLTNIPISSSLKAKEGKKGFFCKAQAITKNCSIQYQQLLHSLTTPKKKHCLRPRPLFFTSSRRTAESS